MKNQKPTCVDVIQTSSRLMGAGVGDDASVTMAINDALEYIGVDQKKEVVRSILNRSLAIDDSYLDEAINTYVKNMGVDQKKEVLQTILNGISDNIKAETNQESRFNPSSEPDTVSPDINSKYTNPYTSSDTSSQRENMQRVIREKALKDKKARDNLLASKLKK